MVQRHVFPQSGDRDDAANFGQLVGRHNATDYVETGLDLTPDYGVPEVTVGAGLAFISAPVETASSTGEDRLRVGYAIQLPETTLGLPDDTTVSVFVEPDLGTDDNATIEVYTDESNATQSALKIGEVDTTSDTMSEVNRAPEAVFDRVEAGDTTLSDIDADSAVLDTIDIGSATVTEIISDQGTPIWDQSTQAVPADSIGIGFGTNLSTTQDGDGTITVDSTDPGAFSDDDGDGLAELLTKYDGIQLPSDELAQFGDDGVSIRFEESRGVLLFRDEQSDSDRLELEANTGDLRIEGEFTEQGAL